MDYIYCRIHILQECLAFKVEIFLYCKITYDKTEKYANNHKFESIQTKLHSPGKVNNTANSSEAFLIKLCHIFTYDRKKINKTPCSNQISPFFHHFFSAAW